MCRAFVKTKSYEIGSSSKMDAKKIEELLKNYVFPGEDDSDGELPATEKYYYEIYRRNQAQAIHGGETSVTIAKEEATRATIVIGWPENQDVLIVANRATKEPCALPKSRLAN